MTKKDGVTTTKYYDSALEPTKQNKRKCLTSRNRKHEYNAK